MIEKTKIRIILVKIYHKQNNYLVKVPTNSQDELTQEQKNYIFSNDLLKDNKLLISLDENSLLAIIKYLYDEKYYKKCINLCL